MMKIEESASGSGSISQGQESADLDPDPDPHQNVMDPQHWPGKQCRFMLHLYAAD